MSRLVNKCSIVDAASDAGGGLSRAKWLGVLVPLLQPRHDGFLQAGNIVEAAATDGLAGNQREPALDQVEPGSAGRVKCSWKRARPATESPRDACESHSYRRSNATPAWDSGGPVIPERR